MVRALIRLSTYTADMEFQRRRGRPQLQLAPGGVLYLHEAGASSSTPWPDGRRPYRRRGARARPGRRRRGGPDSGNLVASRVVVATGGPAAVRRLLPADPGWGDLGPPLTAACLDLGVSRVPDPGYVLSSRRPPLRHRAVTSGPAGPRGRGRGGGHPLRRPERAEDRPQLEQLVREAGVEDDDVVTRRFLAHIPVTGALPLARPAAWPGGPASGHRRSGGDHGRRLGGPVGCWPTPRWPAARPPAAGRADRPGSTKMVA